MEENMNVVNETNETMEDCEVTETGNKKSKMPLMIVAGGVLVGVCIACRRKIKNKINDIRVKKLTKQGYVVIPKLEDSETKDSESETEN